MSATSKPATRTKSRSATKQAASKKHNTSRRVGTAAAGKGRTATKKPGTKALRTTAPGKRGTLPGEAIKRVILDAAMEPRALSKAKIDAFALTMHKLETKKLV